MTLEVLGMFVDEMHELAHQLTEGPACREPGEDSEESRVAAGEDLYRA